jgi:hypothetical protein
MDDVRLMPATCHMEKIFVHPGSIVQFHPKKSERYHDSSTILREHPGDVSCNLTTHSKNIMFTKFLFKLYAIR